mmetsp:Transcript_99687/g.197658  ORF Transcript_99687/g.197658 Transcript_99687/m.197658 type:complete len:556 (-) Transcript_99687:44-1711(-)
MDVLAKPHEQNGAKGLWLHRNHGSQSSELVPLQAACNARFTAAEMFATASSSNPSEVIGVPCQVVGRSLCTDDGSRLLTQLFCAEASSAQLSEPCWPELMIIAIVLPVGGQSGLKGTAVSGVDMNGAQAWFLVSESSPEDTTVRDLLSANGCLRRDFDNSYTKPHDGGSSIIGEGAYATVHLMRAQDGAGVAVKAMNTQVDLEAIEREVATLLEVGQHAHVVAYRGIFWHNEAGQEAMRLSVAFDCVPRGDLLHKVLKYGAMTENTARPIFIGLMNGLVHIHSHHIVHRDIKAENILLKSDDCAVIGDFGLATWVSDEVQMARRCGSPGYVAPEVCLGTPYGFKVDVFGTGVVLYFVLSKEMPFSSKDRDTAATMRKTVKCSLHLHKPPWDGMSSRLRNIMRQTICKTAEERLSSTAALEHPWMLMSCDRSRESREMTRGPSPPSVALHEPEALPFQCTKSPSAAGMADRVLPNPKPRDRGGAGEDGGLGSGNISRRSAPMYDMPVSQQAAAGFGDGSFLPRLPGVQPVVGPGGYPSPDFDGRASSARGSLGRYS